MVYSVDSLLKLGLPHLGILGPHKGASESSRRIEHVSVILNRLHSISSVTSYFSAIDSIILNHTINPKPTRIGTACAAGALASHIMASIIAFAGSKVITLILVNLPSSQSIHDLDLIALRPAQPLRTLTRYVLALFAPTTSDTIASSPSPASPQDADALILSTLARPITLAHLLSSALGVLGFVLAVVGLVAHTWEVLPGATSVTGTICAAVGVMAVVWIAL